MSEDPCPLSDREIEVLRLVATGASNQEIARRLVISVNTVKVHLRNVFEKSGVQSRTEATLYAIRQGLVDVPGGNETDLGNAGPLPSQSLTAAVPELVPVTLWQRLFAVGAAIAGIGLLVATSYPVTQVPAKGNNPISDRPGPTVVSALRPEASRWTSRQSLPSARSRLAVASVGGRVYAIGGDEAGEASDAVDIYSASEDTWIQGESMPEPATNIGAAAVGDRIYVPGGCAGSRVLGVLRFFDVSAGTWEIGSPMLVKVCGYALAQLEDRLVLAGGWDGSVFTYTVQIYDSTSDSWTLGPPLPSPRGFSAATSIDHTVYVVGGFDGQDEMNETLAYDVNVGEWTVKSPMTSARAGLGLAAYGGKLYAIGGGWENYLGTNEAYDVAADRWTPFETPVVGEWRNLGVAVQGPELYAVGGWSGDYLDVNEAYRLSYRVVLPVLQEDRTQ